MVFINWPAPLILTFIALQLQELFVTLPRINLLLPAVEISPAGAQPVMLMFAGAMTAVVASVAPMVIWSQ